jgi:hypothetical protein
MKEEAQVSSFTYVYNNLDSSLSLDNSTKTNFEW